MFGKDGRRGKLGVAQPRSAFAVECEDGGWEWGMTWLGADIGDIVRWCDVEIVKCWDPDEMVAGEMVFVRSRWRDGGEG